MSSKLKEAMMAVDEQNADGPYSNTTELVNILEAELSDVQPSVDVINDRVSSAEHMRESLSSTTENVIRQLIERRNNLVDRLKTKHADRLRAVEMKIEEQSERVKRAMEIASNGAETIRLLQEQSNKDADAAEKEVNETVTQFDKMIDAQKAVLATIAKTKIA